MKTLEMQNIYRHALKKVGVGICVFEINFIREEEMLCVFAENFKVGNNLIQLMQYQGKSIRTVFPNLDFEWLKDKVKQAYELKEDYIDIGTISFMDENKNNYKLKVTALLCSDQKLVILLQDFSRMVELQSVFSELLHKLQMKNKNLKSENQQLESELKDVGKEQGVLDEFSHVVIHDLKAPLHNIMGFGDIVKYELEKGEQTSSEFAVYVDKMIRGAEQMNLLIEELLNFSKMKHQDLKRSPCHLKAIVNEVRTSLESLIQQSRCKLILDNLNQTVIAHETPLRIIFQNILSNALKYSSPDRRLIIRLYVDKYPSKEGEVVIGIQDNGVGMNQKQLKNIMKPFQRGDGVKCEGTGLGMTMVSEAVDLLGARLSIESEQGVGTKVRIYLPKS